MEHFRASGRAGEGRELPVSQLGFGFGMHETAEVIHTISSLLEIRCCPVPLGLVCDVGSEGAVLATAHAVGPGHRVTATTSPAEG